MDPVTIAILVKILGGAAGAAIVATIYWPEIIHYLTTCVVPWVRQKLSNDVAALLAELFDWLDGKVVTVRRGVKHLWAAFTKNVLGSKKEFTKVSATAVRGKTTTIIQDQSGKFQQQIVEEEIAWENLPPEIRREFNVHAKISAELDQKAVLAELVKQKAASQGVALEMTH